MQMLLSTSFTFFLIILRLRSWCNKKSIEFDAVQSLSSKPPLTNSHLRKSFTSKDLGWTFCFVPREKVKKKHFFIKYQKL